MKIKILLITLMFLITACGYTPIFKTSTNLFKIEEYETLGNTQIANNFINSLKKFENNSENSLESIFISIDAKKNKEALLKDSSGKIITYKVDLVFKIIVKSNISKSTIFEDELKKSVNFKNKDSESETDQLEDKIIQDTINTLSRNLIVKINQSITIK